MAQPQVRGPVTDTCSYHAHQELVEPLQFELGLGPHVRAQGGLQESHTPAGQHLPWGSRGVGVVVNLQTHSNSRPHFTGTLPLSLAPSFHLTATSFPMTQLSLLHFRDTADRPIPLRSPAAEPVGTGAHLWE